VATVHGDLGQGQRERALRAFRSGKVDVLTATEVAARGLDVDDVTHVVNYECPDDEMTYVHRIGRTGRAGRAGVAVTFVDWRDMHRWKLIDAALGLDMAEPVETYSTSEHLFTELDIPREATGTLPRAMRDRAGLEAEAVEDIGETGKIRSPRHGSAGRGSGSSGGRGSRGGRNRTSTGDGAAQAVGTAGRRRRRTRAGREVGAAESGAQPRGDAAPEQSAGQASEQGSEQAPRLRRRRRTSARSGNQSEETRRKAS
jgi:superfamily II DNA/RNA helicase